MTVKRRGKPVLYTWVATRPNGTVAIGPELYSLDNFEVIRDSTSKSKRKINSFNYCRHERVECKVFGYVKSFMNSSGVTQWTTNSTGIRGGWNPNWTDVVAPTGFLGRAYQTLIPRLSGDSEGLIFLAGLKSLLGTFSSIRSTIRKLMQGLKSIRAWVRAAAQGHLTYQFGVKQAVSDVLSFASSYSAFKQKVDTLNGMSGRVLVSHYSETVDHPGSSSTYKASHGESYITKREPFSSTWTVTMRYRCALQVKLPPTLHNYLRYMGLNRPIGAAWDLIPYSFVFDWFINIGRYLRSFDFDRLPCSLEVLQFGTSVKHTQEISVSSSYVKPPSGSYYLPLGDRGICHSAKRTFYERAPQYPAGLYQAWATPLVGSKVTQGKLVTGGALLAR